MASRLDPAQEQMIHNGIRSLEVIGAHLTGEAQREAPIEKGTLRATGTWRIVYDENGRRYWVEVSFSTVYARRQHEETTWKHPQGGKAHYLSDPHKANVVRYEDLMRRAILSPTRLP